MFPSILEQNLKKIRRSPVFDFFPIPILVGHLHPHPRLFEIPVPVTALDIAIPNGREGAQSTI
jgi:hypothetical protein